MRAAWLWIGLCGAVAGNVMGQAVPTKKKPDVFTTPAGAVGKKLKRTLTDEDFRGYLWNFSRDTMPDDMAIRENVKRSELMPFQSRRSVWAAATMPLRAAEYGTGKYSAEANQRPTLEDRIAASEMPEKDYAAKADDSAILAAVYRHFFDYRMQGFAAATRRENDRLRENNPNLRDVYFLGLGPHIDDAPPSLLAALQNDPDIQRDKVRLRPLSKVLEVTAEAIRDRDTGAYGPAFRVDAVGPVENGRVKVLATFTEREGFWFTREFTLEPDKAGWKVTADADVSLN